MYLINYIKLSFAFFTSTIVAVGCLINFFEEHLPKFVVQGFRYGKFSYKGHQTFIGLTEVPKRLFRHFYIYSSLLSCIVLGVLSLVFIFGVPTPPFLREFLDRVASVFRETNVAPTKAFLATVLLTIQCFRRLYDTNFVSIFGDNSKINLSHYLIGYIHYTGAYLAVLAEVPLNNQLSLKWADLSMVDVVASVVFLWACWHQFEATKILANLRKDEHGRVVTNGHRLPHGDWFNFVSSPHILSEILMYFALTLILWENTTWFYIFAWVLANQVETALLAHWWYQENFKELPPERKALIPWIL